MDSGQGAIHLHYWLTTSQSATPSKDPLVLWMKCVPRRVIPPNRPQLTPTRLLPGSGGPGASSVVFGFFGELGPYFMDDRSLRNTTTPGVPDLFDNPYAWNKIANVLCPPLAPPCTLVPRRVAV